MIFDRNGLAAMQRRYDEQEDPGYFDSRPDETELPLRFVVKQQQGDCPREVSITEKGENRRCR